MDRVVLGLVLGGFGLLFDGLCIIAGVWDSRMFNEIAHDGLEAGIQSLFGVGLIYPACFP